MVQVFVDETHCGRHVTGLERITLELFSAEALAPIPLTPIRAGGRKGMMVKQFTTLPSLALRNPKALILCPGFPPSEPLQWVARDRLIPYIHDLFLITRPQDLNWRAALYMARPFRTLVERGRFFLTNSETTTADLRRFCRPDADIQLYRPTVRNVFGLSAEGRGTRPVTPGVLKLVAVGTVEPRKNLGAAVDLLAALRRRAFPLATLDIVGRPGWGVDLAALGAAPGVTVHGYQPAERARDLIEGADALLSTSHDEGLGLPLLEAQYAGLAVLAPQKPVFGEVLAQSGQLLDLTDFDAAAAQIETAFSGEDWRGKSAEASLNNIRRWNGAAAADRTAVIASLSKRLETTT